MTTIADLPRATEADRQKPDYRRAPDAPQVDEHPGMVWTNTGAGNYEQRPAPPPEGTLLGDMAAQGVEPVKSSLLDDMAAEGVVPANAPQTSREKGVLKTVGHELLADTNEALRSGTRLAETTFKALNYPGIGEWFGSASQGAESLAAQNPQWRTQMPESFGGFATDPAAILGTVAGSVPKLVGAGAAGAAGTFAGGPTAGTAAAMAYWGATSAQDTYDSLTAQGVDPQSAKTAAQITGAVMALAGNSRVTHFLSMAKGTQAGLINRVLGELGHRMAGKTGQVAGDIIGEAFHQALIQVAMEGGNEAAIAYAKGKLEPGLLNRLAKAMVTGGAFGLAFGGPAKLMAEAGKTRELADYRRRLSEAEGAGLDAILGGQEEVSPEAAALYNTVPESRRAQTVQELDRLMAENPDFGVQRPAGTSDIPLGTSDVPKLPSLPQPPPQPAPAAPGEAISRGVAPTPAPEATVGAVNIHADALAQEKPSGKPIADKGLQISGAAQAQEMPPVNIHTPPPAAKPAPGGREAWDKSGADMPVVHHGGEGEVAEVDTSKLGQRDAGFYGPGFYVSESPAYSKNYGKIVSSFRFNPDARILDVGTIHPEYEQKGHAELQKAIEDAYRADLQRTAVPRVRDNPKLLDGYVDMVRPGSGAFDVHEWVRQVAKYAKDNGYDAIRWSKGEIVVMNPKAITKPADAAPAKAGAGEGKGAGKATAIEQLLASMGLDELKAIARKTKIAMSRTKGMEAKLDLSAKLLAVEAELRKRSAAQSPPPAARAKGETPAPAHEGPWTNLPREYHGRTLYDWGQKGYRMEGNVAVQVPGQRAKKVFDKANLRDFAHVPPGLPRQLLRAIKDLSGGEFLTLKTRKGKHWNTERYYAPKEAVAEAERQTGLSLSEGRKAHVARVEERRAAKQPPVAEPSLASKAMGAERMPALELAAGDEFTINGERYSVKDIDPDTEAAIIEDGVRKTVDRHESVIIDPGSLRRAEVSGAKIGEPPAEGTNLAQTDLYGKPTGDLFAVPQPKREAQAEPRKPMTKEERDLAEIARKFPGQAEALPGVTRPPSEGGTAGTEPAPRRVVSEEAKPARTSLDDAADAARARIAARKAGKSVSLGSGLGDIYDIVKDYAIVGAQVLRDMARAGIAATKDAWKRRMIESEGKDVEPHLDRIWGEIPNTPEGSEVIGKHPEQTAGVKNAWVDQVLSESGKAPAQHGPARSDVSVAEEAAQAFKEDPFVGKKLVDGILANPRPLTVREEGILLHESARLVVERQRAETAQAEAIKSGDADAQREAAGQAAQAALDFGRWADAATIGGTHVAQSLSFRRRMMNLDYSLAAMERSAAIAKGDTLTAPELAEVKTLQAKIAELLTTKADLEAKNAALEGQKADAEAVKASEAAHAKLLEEMRAMQGAKEAAEGRAVMAERQARMLERQAGKGPSGGPAAPAPPRAPGRIRFTEPEQARLTAAFARIKAKLSPSRMGAGLGGADITVVKDLGEVAALYIKAGVRQFGKWAAEMVKNFGKEIEPHLNAAWREGRKESLAGITEPIVRRLAGKLSKDPRADIAPAAQVLARSFVEAGIRNRNALVDAVHAEIKKAAPEVTRREVMDAISGYGKYRGLSKGEIETALRDLKGQLQQIGKLEDMAAKEAPKRTGFQRREPSEAERELIKLVNAAKEEGGYEVTDPEAQLKSAVQSLKTRTVNRIADLQKQMRENQFPKKIKRELPRTPEQVALDYKLETVLRQWAERRQKWVFANQTVPQKALRYGGELLNLPRSFMTSMDLSATLRQAGVITLGHPILGAKMVKVQVRALASEKAAFGIEDAIRQDPQYRQSRVAGLELTGHGETLAKMEEAFMSRWAEKVPGVKQSQRAYTVGLNWLRFEMFKKMTRGLSRTGESTPAEMKAIAKFINIATGRGTFGASSGLATLNTFLFAPRYFASRIQMMLGVPLWRGSWRTRTMVLKEYGRFLAGVAVVYALGMAAGGQVEKDPRSSDFGKVRFGDSRIDPLTGLAQITTFASRMTTGETKNAHGEVKPLRGDVRFGQQDMSDVIKNFLRSKLAPVPALAWNILAGKDVVGQPVTPGRVAFNFLPISGQDMIQAMQAEGVPIGLALGILSMLGMGVQNYQEHQPKSSGGSSGLKSSLKPSLPKPRK
jgi:hypothetical protein